MALTFSFVIITKQRYILTHMTANEISKLCWQLNMIVHFFSSKLNNSWITYAFYLQRN